MAFLRLAFHAAVGMNRSIRLMDLSGIMLGQYTGVADLSMITVVEQSIGVTDMLMK